MAHPRNRAERRAFARKKPARKYKPDLDTHFFNNKDWKLLYLHSIKLARAKQLGKLWPYPKQQLELLLLSDDGLEDLDATDPSPS